MFLSGYCNASGQRVFVIDQCAFGLLLVNFVVFVEISVRGFLPATSITDNLFLTRWCFCY